MDVVVQPVLVLGAGAATTSVGGDRSRRQRQVAGRSTELVKGFPTLILWGGDTFPADFISCSFLPLGFRDPWVRHKGVA